MWNKNREKRHPRTCRFYKEYRIRKFSDLCRYENVQPENNLLTEVLKNKLKVFERVLDDRDSEINHLEIESSKERNDKDKYDL